ncbi:uncharacterized protein LOC106013230 [Aplysia californica]|uniref:Uncharacterized protein LOC106013230 n=1 Tax=Aplysia californica TaxID=6500 RepID=A0ABM1AA81_APLCA|nr:uncharacterized protein LOC106013230 [Aplysia californica]
MEWGLEGYHLWMVTCPSKASRGTKTRHNDTNHKPNFDTASDGQHNSNNNNGDYEEDNGHTENAPKPGSVLGTPAVENILNTLKDDELGAIWDDVKASNFSRSKFEDFSRSNSEEQRPLHSPQGPDKEKSLTDQEQESTKPRTSGGLPDENTHGLSTVTPSCKNRNCGDPSRVPCACGGVCAWTGNCCDDINDHCPGEEEKFLSKLPFNVRHATASCIDYAEYLGIIDCPSRGGRSDIRKRDVGVFDLDQEDIVGYLKSITPVFDKSTKIIYKNVNVFRCYATEDSNTLLWSVNLAPQNDHVFDSINTTSDLFYLIRRSVVNGFLLPIDDIEVELCSSAGQRSVFLEVGFSDTELLIKNRDVNKYPWKSIRCGELQNESCSLELCHIGGEKVDNYHGCVYPWQLRVTVVYPSPKFEAEVVDSISKQLICLLRSSSEILTVEVSQGPHIPQTENFPPIDHFTIDFRVNLTRTKLDRSYVVEILSSVISVHLEDDPRNFSQDFRNYMKGRLRAGDDLLSLTGTTARPTFLNGFDDDSRIVQGDNKASEDNNSTAGDLMPLAVCVEVDSNELHSNEESCPGFFQLIRYTNKLHPGCLEGIVRYRSSQTSAESRFFVPIPLISFLLFATIIEAL